MKNRQNLKIDMIKMNLLLTIFIIILLNSCLYIPTPEHAGELTIPDEIFNKFAPGKTTLADVLLQLGKPIQRLEGDRYLLYHWETVVGYVIAGGGGGGVVVPNLNAEYLCLEFTSANVLKRYKHFERGIGGILSSHPEDDILKWMNKNHGDDLN